MPSQMLQRCVLFVETFNQQNQLPVMKFFGLGFLMIAFIVGCAEKSDCSRFKNGKFYLKIPSSKEKIIIERNDTIQVETNTTTGEGSKSRIEWLNECEYRIIAITNNKILKDRTDSFFAAIPIDIAITSTGKDYYVFKTKIDSANKHVEYNDTVRVEY